MEGIRRHAARYVASALLVCSSFGVHATVYVVGTPVGAGQCSHATVQAAVAAAAVNPGADTIRVTRSVSWTAQQISIDSDQDLEIDGGFATCTSGASDGTATVLDGSGGDPKPVFAIRGNGIVKLRNLTITGGDQNNDNNGGGIYYEGGGELNIADSTITQNTAYDGGGIYAKGTADTAELVLGQNVLVSFNTARKSGGGVVANSLEMSLRGPGSALLFNTAQGQGGSGGNGGGLALVSDAFVAYAYISSNGIGDIGAIYSNNAVNGGGVAVLGGEESGHDSTLEVFSTNSANTTQINANIASNHGGGIYLHSDADNTSGDANAYALLSNARLDANSAADGAALYLDYDPGSTVGFDRGDTVYFGSGSSVAVSPDAVACPFGRPCGFITNNTTSTSTGAVIRVVSSSIFSASRVAIQNNGGGRLAYLTATTGGVIDYDPSFALFDALVTGNATAQELFRQAGAGESSYHHITVADNQVGAGYLFHGEQNLAIDRSLIAQPGKATLDSGASANAAIAYLISNDAALVGANVAAPRFVDPGHGDYTLQAGSVAVDYAPPPATPLNDTADINSHNRTLDLPNIPNLSGVGDLGAFEREAFDPLVLNADFNQDLRLWDATTGATWDATQNASGIAGSGSLKGTLAVDDARLVVRSQCIHVPGPGTYVLNGYGRATHATPRNQAKLAWEVRRNGGVFGCKDGAADSTGEMLLANDSTWVKPSAGASISIPGAIWGDNTSITVYAVGINGNPIAPGMATSSLDGGGVNVWFDGIALTRMSDDLIFANGFEP